MDNVKNNCQVNIQNVERNEFVFVLANFYSRSMAIALRTVLA
jgi:hypothetical protein